MLGKVEKKGVLTHAIRPAKLRKQARKRLTMMKPIMECIKVDLADRSYDILIGHDWLENFGTTLREREKTPNAMIFTSPRIGGLYYDKLARGLQQAGFINVVRHDIPDGDKHKNLEQYVKAMEAIAFHFHPDQTITPLTLNLGGGVVGDIGGYVAGTYARGNAAPYVQLPTTLLACVDSSVGGKTGVDVLGIKNVAGLFCQPHLVLIDLHMLTTLEPAELRSGLAEVIKYGVVCDRDLFELLESRMDDLLSLKEPILGRVVAECCRIKADIVQQDEKDDPKIGKRIVLNFGHTIGHAIESASNFRLKHGEAISIGMLAATRLALDLERCNNDLYERLLNLVRRAGLPASVSGLDLDIDEVMKAMEYDKKFINGQNCFVLPTELGNFCVERGVDAALVLKATKSSLG